MGAILCAEGDTTRSRGVGVEITIELDFCSVVAPELECTIDSLGDACIRTNESEALTCTA